MPSVSTPNWDTILAAVLPALLLTVLLAAVVRGVLRGLLQPKVLIVVLVLLALGVINLTMLKGFLVQTFAFFFDVVQSAYAATVTH